MEAKFLILFVTVFFNGVTTNTVSTLNAPDMPPPQALPTTVATNHYNISLQDSTNLSSSAPTNKNISEVDSKERISENAQTPASNNSTKSSQKTDANGATTVPVASSGGKPTEAPQTQDRRNATISPNSAPKNSLEGNKTDSSTVSDKIPPAVVPASKGENVTTTNATAATNTTHSGSSTNTTTTITPASTKKLISTTPAPPTTMTKIDSVVEGHESTATSSQKERGFDGASFFGGIVLTVGLTAIGFIAFKYYKSGKIGMNYRTL